MITYSNETIQKPQTNVYIGLRTNHSGKPLITYWIFICGKSFRLQIRQFSKVPNEINQLNKQDFRYIKKTTTRLLKKIYETLTNT